MVRGTVLMKISCFITTVYTKRPGDSSGKALGYGLDGLGSIPSGDFSSLLRVQTGPGVHSSSYKMSTGEFPRG